MASSSSLLVLLALFAGLHFSPPRLAVAKCVKLSIKNGFVRLRSRGRIARFSCNAGYILYGDRYAACMNNRWDVSPPLCIRPGCAAFEEGFKFGQWHSSYNEAVLRFTCDPGLRLVGSTVVFCDGLQWSATMPYCIARNRVEVHCDLEGTSSTTCGWSHDPKSDFLWRVHQFSTPSAPLGTGPSHDHTLGPGANGHYLYLETSGAKLASDRAKLFSPIYPPIPNTNSTFCFVFWYHMYGSTIGELNVYLNDRIVFEKKGNQGNRWLKARIPLAPMKTSFQVVLEGTRGTGYVGDIAVDDFSISRNVECSSDRDYRSCRDRCNETTAVDPGVCHCHPGCFESDTCCSDIHVFCVSEVTTVASPGQGYSEGASGGTEEAGDADGQEETTSSTGEDETEVYSGESLTSLLENDLTTVVAAVVARSTRLSHETTTTGKHEVNSSTTPSPEKRTPAPVEIVTSKNVSAGEENTTRIPFREKMNSTQHVSNNITTSPVETVTRNSNVLSNGVKYYTALVENATESDVRETSRRNSGTPVTEDVSKGYEEYGTEEVVRENRTAGRSGGMKTTEEVAHGTTEQGDIIWIREELHKTGSGTTGKVKVVETTPGSRPATIVATPGVATERKTHKLTTVSTHNGVTTRGTTVTAKTTTPYSAVVTTGRTTPAIVTTGRTTPTVFTAGRTTPTVFTAGRTTPTVFTTRRKTPAVVTQGTTRAVVTQGTTPAVVTQGTTVTTRETITTLTTRRTTTTPKVLTTMEITIPVANTTVATLGITSGREQAVKWWDDYRKPTDKWKSKWKPKSKVEAVAVIGEEGDGRGEGVALAVVGVAILTALAVLLVLLGLRFRRLRRPSPHDPATDVLFLASDEALDFTVARPDNTTAETFR